MYIHHIFAENAFDKIDGMLLMYKLRRLSVSGLLYKTIETVYEEIECYVNINNNFTDKVRQGHPLN